MSTAPTDASRAEHYAWGANCDGWHLVKTPELSIILERMLPGASEVRHFHHRSRQFFFVLEGALTMEVGQQRFVLQAHQGIEVLPGEPHQASNRGTADTRFTITSQPPSHDDRVVV
jgi:mannose-6-phosphate isomerase-like protein (cupin superfamily)